MRPGSCRTNRLAQVLHGTQVQHGDIQSVRVQLYREYGETSISRREPVSSKVEHACMYLSSLSGETRINGLGVGSRPR